MSRMRSQATIRKELPIIIEEMAKNQRIDYYEIVESNGKTFLRITFDGSFVLNKKLDGIYRGE